MKLRERRMSYLVRVWQSKKKKYNKLYVATNCDKATTMFLSPPNNVNLWGRDRRDTTTKGVRMHAHRHTLPWSHTHTHTHTHSQSHTLTHRNRSTFTKRHCAKIMFSCMKTKQKVKSKRHEQKHFWHEPPHKNNTDPVLKRLNKTSDLHPFNVQYSPVDTENTGTKLDAKLPLAFVKYFFFFFLFSFQRKNKKKVKEINGALEKKQTKKKKTAIYSDRFTYLETLSMNCN